MLQPSQSPVSAAPDNLIPRASNALEQIWLEAMSEFKIPLDYGHQVIHEILAAHSAPDRHYHNLVHLYEMSQFLRGDSVRLHAPHEVSLAVLFHDFVYSPSSGLNEMHSAQTARAHLCKLDLPEAAITRIESLILATKVHQPVAGNPDSRFFLDADLAILGRDPARYLEYAKAIRSEYCAVPHNDYCSGRADVMSTFLARPAIYLESYEGGALEQRARQNIQNEIRVLRSSALQPDISWAQFAA